MNLTFREAMLTFKRAPLLSALSVTTIAFSLFVLGLFGLVVVNLQDALRGVEERVEVVAYLLPGAPVEAVAQALKDIEAFPEVQSATYVSEDDALARARAELVELRDVMQELERNPLPASIEVKLKPGFRDTDHVSAVAERLRGFGFVDDVRFGRDWVEKLDRLRGLAAAVGIVVGAAFAVVPAAPALRARAGWIRGIRVVAGSRAAGVPIPGVGAGGPGTPDDRCARAASAACLIRRWGVATPPV